MNTVWFHEPNIIDDSIMKTGENTIDWLNRSTWKRAKACREYLNNSLNILPINVQESLFKALIKNWDSGFFELSVAIALHGLNAELEYETESGKGNTYIDFLVKCPDMNILIEAVAPQINRTIGKHMSDINPLITIIENNLPKGWLIWPTDLPYISPSESKKDFKAQIIKALNIPPPINENEVREITIPYNEGIIGIRLIAGDSNKQYNRIAASPAFAFHDDTVERVKHALQKKRSKSKKDTTPLIIAIRGAAFAKNDYEEFDIALFGRTTATVDNFGNVLKKGFDANGEMAKSTSEIPTIAGVLVFSQVGWSSCTPPVLYIHPKYKGPFPKSFMQLEHREYVSDLGIKIKPATYNPFENIKFVDPTID